MWWVIGGVLALLVIFSITYYFSGYRLGLNERANVTTASASSQPPQGGDYGPSSNNPPGFDPFVTAVAAPSKPAPGMVREIKASIAVSPIKVDQGSAVVLLTEDHATLARLYVEKTLDSKQVMAAFKQSISALPLDRQPPREVMEKFEELFLNGGGFQELFRESVEEVKAQFGVEELKVLVVNAIKYPWINEKLGLPKIYEAKRTSVGAKYIQIAQAPGPKKE